MAISSIQWAFIALLNLATICIGAPIHDHDVLLLETGTFSSNIAIALSIGILILCAVLLFGCTCCPHKDGTITNSSQCPIRHLNQNNISQLQHNSEFAIFPPCSSVISLQPVHSGGFGNETEKIIFEPLPDILPKRHVNGQNLAQSSKPAHFSALLKKKNSLHDWFDDPSSNFPRNQLQYLREMGNGWFGRVVEGEAQKITEGQEKTPVMVKILREEASPSEHLYFLHEVRPYRNLQHANVLRLLGRCLETDPFLLIMEHTIMDLKSYLIKHHDTFMKKDDLGNEQLLQWALDITSGLMHMHEHGFTHTDLAAHNCFLTIENGIKIGDYGLSFNVFREDYYCLGDIALPIRWYSPETLLCSETTIEAKDSTKEANIWSLAVVFWELLEFGKLPYADMNNEDVLQNVIIERSVQLKAPQLHHPHKEQMFQVMRLCWNPPPLRPKIQEIEMLLRQIYEHKDFLKSFASFEERWNALQSESNSVTRDIMLRFENDFVPNADNRSASIFSTEGNVSESSAFELSGSEVMQRNFDSYLSASLRGLNGSFDEIGASDFEPANVPLAASGNASARGSFSNSHSIFDDNSDSFQNLEVVTPEEISEAIRDLDAMLATEAMLLGVDSRSTTLERPKDKCKHLNHEDYMPSDGVSKLQKLNEYDIDCSDPETDMEASDISCPKLIVEKDIYERTVSLYSPISSIQYFENDDDTPVVSPDDDILRSSLESKFIKPPVVTSDEGLGGDFEDNESENKPYSLFDHHTTTVPAPSTSDPGGSDSWQKDNNSKVNEIALVSENRLPLIPDIVIDPSVSCEENDSYDSEKCETNEEVPAVDLPKPKLRNFRFVLKEDSVESLPSRDSDLLNISIENNAQEGVEKSLESSGPLTSTPTKDIAFFNDDRFHNLNQSSEELCPDVSLISYKTSTTTTNSECYESAANTLTSEIAPNSTDYETAASTFNLTNGSVFNLSNESITDPSVIDTVFGNSHTFTKDVTSSTGITESSSFSYVEPKSDVEVQLSPLSTTQHDSQISDTSENVTGLPEDIQNDGCISGLLDYKAEAYIPHTQNVALPNTIKNSDSCGNTTSNFSNVLDTFHPSHTIGEMQDDSQQNEDCTSRDWSSSQNQTDSREFAVIELLNEGEETGISDTVSDSFAFKKECEWSVMDDTSTEALTFSEGLTQSISDTISDSFTYDKSLAFDKLVNQSEVRSELTDSSLFVKPASINSAPENSSDNSSSNLINHNIEKVNSTTFTTNSEYHLGGQEEMTIEDLETEESASYVISDNYDEPLDEDDVLKIDVETNEAILVDSTQSLIGFVPSRSIEMLQECNDIASHYDAPMLDSLTVEGTGSSSTSPGSSSPQILFNPDVVSSQCNGMIVEHLNCSAESSPATIFSSSEELVSDDENLDNKHQITNTSTATLELNNNAECDSSSPDPYNDVIFSTQPTKSVVWHSDETLDILDENEPNGNSRSVIIESQEIMAGSNYSTEIQTDDTKSGLDNAQFGSSDFLDRLAISPASSPQDSVASTPCRDIVYTPDFESESEDSSSSCSSTSGSFECIHNKFKDIGDISAASEEVSKEPPPPISDEKDSKETSPMKIFSTTWDCHATPNKGLLKTPEKKVLPMRKSVSFHDEPQLVFQYPPASDSSEEDCVEDANEFSWHVDYTSYADWDLQVSEEDDIPEEMIEIEELDSEPYNRSLYRGNRPLSQPAMYTITGFSDDEDLDLPEMKGSSQFSTIPDFRLSSERESPVRVSTTNQGLTLIKEGPDGEEELTIEEVFTGVSNTEEKSAANDDVIKIQITFPDSEIVEPDAVHESNHVNYEDINEISKTISDLDLPKSVKEGANVENDIVHQVPAIEIKEISINEQPLSNLVVLNSNENKLSKLETETCNVLGSESLNDHSPTMEIIPEAISPSHQINSHVNIEISNKNHFMISERILEDDNGIPTHTNKEKTANAHREDPGDINKDSVENINSAVSMYAEKEVVMDTDKEISMDVNEVISMNTDKEVFRNANKQVSVDADKEEVSMNAEQEVSESGNKGVSMTDGEVFANTDGKVSTSNDKKVSTDINTEVSTDTDREVSTNTDREVSTNTDGEVSTDIDRKISTDINMEVSTDINMEVSTDTDRKVSTDIDRKVSTDINNEVTKDVKKMVSQDANKEINRDVEEKVSEDAGGEIHIDADKADVENTDKDIPTDAHKEVVNTIEKINTHSENQSKDLVNECVSDASHISENNLLSDLSSPTVLDEKNSLGKNTVMVTVSHENDCGEKTNGTFSQSLKHTESSDNESVSCSDIAIESVKCSSHNAELDMAEDESNIVLDSQLNTKADNAGLESMIPETAVNIDDSVTNSVSAAIPSIVVTDTGEEFIDGENLEEFLSDHLKFYENEAGNAAEFCKDDGFVVTSDFSETPFEDPFGYYNGTNVDCDDDFNFVEAVNHHCSAQAFDDLLNFTEDAPLQNGYIPNQSSVDEIPTERSTSLPVMNDEKAIKTEKPLGFSSL